MAAAVYGAIGAALPSALLRVGPRGQRAGTHQPELPFAGDARQRRDQRTRASVPAWAGEVVQAWRKACSGRVRGHGTQKLKPGRLFRWWSIREMCLSDVICNIYPSMSFKLIKYRHMQVIEYRTCLSIAYIFQNPSFWIFQKRQSDRLTIWDTKTQQALIVTKA